MKLHYSQTCSLMASANARFQYLMKLHYSQTTQDPQEEAQIVSVPYEITLLSNGERG